MLDLVAVYTAIIRRNRALLNVIFGVFQNYAQEKTFLLKTRRKTSEFRPSFAGKSISNENLRLKKHSLKVF